ncbi:GAF and ANTAR domain-containing protein [Rhodococcus sp. NPDC059968]|uniref:GAF and ANTAR domain-containing protein n=1 Tax=Rhodococcus sp. NPDC059968 TaxID=3347017 RepID=UPI003673180D
MEHPATPGPPVNPATVFTALAEIVYNRSSDSEVYAAICVAATLLVPGCDHASVMLRDGDTYVTVAASDDVARRIDDLERTLGEGPCVDAIDDETTQIEPNLATPTKWPRLAARILAGTPVRGAMGFPLLVEERKIGALNLFTDTAGIFTDGAAEHAVILAAFAGVTVSAISGGAEAATLRAGLDSNREIGKAIGLLMALHHISDDDAIALLRRTSQLMNIKIAEIARRMIDQHRNSLS